MRLSKFLSIAVISLVADNAANATFAADCIVPFMQQITQETAPDATRAEGRLAASLGELSVPFPEARAQVAELFKKLTHSRYSKQIKRWRVRGTALNPSERERLWRMAVKHDWRLADASPRTALPEVRPKMTTNIERNMEESTVGMRDESPDPAAPFAMTPEIVRPKGMPDGVYSTASGRWGTRHTTLNDLLANRRPQSFEIEYRHRMPDGRIVLQSGGYADPGSSWGWDGRLELQPNGRGGHDLKVTQGCMELPSTLQGASTGVPDLPNVANYNSTRNRHIFTPVEWVPATQGKPAKLVVMDEGSILGSKPSTEGHWVEKNHRHGYGENFVPDPADPRKPWKDAEGYTYRVFDEVTKETTLKNVDGSLRFIPTETRSVGYRMDQKNPSKVVPAGVKLTNGQPANAPIFFTSNYLPGTQKIAPAAERYAFDVSGTPVEERIYNADGTMTVVTTHLSNPVPALNEGNNQVGGLVIPRVEETRPGLKLVPSKGYYLMSGSAGEYMSGGLSRLEQFDREKNRLIALGREGEAALAKLNIAQFRDTQYGTYLWTRRAEEGPIGMYRPVLTADGKDFLDQLHDLTQMYGISWGIGRPQFFKDELGQWWLKGHGVDVDLLVADIPQAGNAKSAYDFANKYRRHQILLPVEFIEKDGILTIRIRDQRVLNDIEAWRIRMAGRSGAAAVAKPVTRSQSFTQ